MDPDHVEAQVRELSGMDVQAVTLVRTGPRDTVIPRVWAVMTEHGQFWVAEDGATMELFRAVNRASGANPLTCQSAVEAARRFLMLHPRPAAPPSPVVVSQEVRPAGSTETCEVCGESFTRRVRRPQQRMLCARCRHAEHERLRYQQDPRYRARRLAYSAARYRERQQTQAGG
jgi:hypothetical protein